jgi:uncharacterized protein (TIGR02001 family)
MSTAFTRVSRFLRSVTVAGAMALAASLALPASQASAFEIESAGLTVTATPAFTSDYLFRGISQTRRRPALQGTVDIQHESGVYVGAFVSNVAFQGYNGGTEIDGLFGYRREIAGITWDLGGVWYTYPGSHTRGLYELSYFEAVLKATKDLEVVKLMGTVAWSPNAFGRSGTGWYLEGGADIPLPFDFVGNLRLGYWNLERNGRFGTPDYIWYGAGVTREIWEGITVAAGVYGTDIAKRDCVPTSASPRGQTICGVTGLVTISRAF